MNLLKHLFISILFLTFLHGNLNAFIGNSQSGIDETFLIIQNGAATTFYDLYATTANPDFQGSNLGVFSCGSNALVLKGGQNKVFKCTGGDITSCQLFYRVYLSGTTPGPFISINLGFFSEFTNGCGGKNQTWETGNANINLLNGLASGTYILEVYSIASNVNANPNIIWYASNNGANYSATFTVNTPSITGFASQPLCAGQLGSISYSVSNASTYTVTHNGSSISNPYTNLAGGIYSIMVTDANSCTAVTTLAILSSPTPVVITALGNNPLCYGLPGTINFSTSGGTGSIIATFLGTVVSSPMLNLGESIYTIVATDVNNCSASTTIFIDEPDFFDLQVASTNVLCNGGNGSITGGITGGVSPYIFTVNGQPFATTYPAGTYTCMATDANGCTITSVVNISQPNAISIMPIYNNILCNGGTTNVSFNISGGVGPYLGASALNNISAGSYTVIITDSNGCVNSLPYTITEPALLVPSISISNNPVLANTNQVFVLAATGGLPNYNFSFSTINNGVVNTSTFSFTPTVNDDGIYSLTVTDANNCTATTEIYLSVMPNSLFINAKVILGGNFNSVIGLMTDSLRQKNFIPSMEPFSNFPYNQKYVHVLGGGESIAPGVLTTAGNDAIVDWVLIELRDSANPALIVGTKSALLQRDGDVVSANDGLSYVEFENNAPGNYFVAIRHANHLGIMTANTLNLSANTTTIDFTSVNTNLYIKSAPNNNSSPYTGATNIINGKRVLYAGNCGITGIGQSNINYAASSWTDRSALQTATGVSGTINGYSLFDCNLDGVAKFGGLNPDRLVILNTVKGLNSSVIEQLP
jgi:hypothetical protein